MKVCQSSCWPTELPCTRPQGRFPQAWSSVGSHVCPVTCCLGLSQAGSNLWLWHTLWWWHSWICPLVSYGVQCQDEGTMWLCNQLYWILGRRPTDPDKGEIAETTAMLAGSLQGDDLVQWCNLQDRASCQGEDDDGALGILVPYIRAAWDSQPWGSSVPWN
jgi:hypothetical protein